MYLKHYSRLNQNIGEENVSKEMKVTVNARTKMKVITIIIIAVFWQNNSVYCHDFFTAVAMKFGEFSRSVTDTFDGIFNKVHDFIIPTRILRTSPVDMDLIEEQLKRSFHEFVERTAAEVKNDDEVSEFINVKSEPTVLMSTPQLADMHGKQIDTHVIKTKDGYLLTLHRISNSNTNVTENENQTVLLHHGLLGSSADWILLGPEKSLPYILSNAGYDVWMANARGNYYSRAHVSRSVKSPQFWNFSWQEMGEYDLPAVIDYIRKIQNNSNQINFIGHSMGATALLVLLSTNPRYNDYLRLGILLAPLVFMDNIQSPLRILTTMSSSPPTQLLKAIGDTEFLPTRKIPKTISKKLCNGLKIYCHNPLLFFTGGLLAKEKYNASFVARLLYHVPAGGSTNTILHFGQLVQNGKFHRFNRQNSEFPLHYVTLPIVMFSSDEDLLASISDILRLYFNIGNPLDHYIIRDKNLSHTEFVWGAQADKWVFPKVIDYLKNGLTQEIIKDNEV